MSLCTLRKTYKTTPKGSSVNKVIVICNKTGIKKSSYEGEHGKGLKRALALLGEKCTCGKSWHYVSKKDLKYYNPEEEWESESSDSSDSESECSDSRDPDSEIEYTSNNEPENRAEMIRNYFIENPEAMSTLAEQIAKMKVQNGKI